MTISELKKQIENLPEDMEVFILNSGDGIGVSICRPMTDISINAEQNTVCFSDETAKLYLTDVDQVENMPFYFVRYNLMW